MRKNIRSVKNDLKQVLDKKRYEHTIGVSYTAICLAMKYECDLDKAELAGLLHDCAKCIPDEKKLKQCIKYNININEIECNNPYLLHAKLGAFYAMNKYDISDSEIIHAILKHTTGAPNMTMLEKIIYVADCIEPRRSKMPNLARLRKLAFEDIDKAVCSLLGCTLSYLKENQRDIDPMTIKAYEYYSTHSSLKTPTKQ